MTYKPAMGINLEKNEHIVAVISLEQLLAATKSVRVLILKRFESELVYKRNHLISDTDTLIN